MELVYKVSAANDSGRAVVSVLNHGLLKIESIKRSLYTVDR